MNKVDRIVLKIEEEFAKAKIKYTMDAQYIYYKNKKEQARGEEIIKRIESEGK